jgi:hypothetical protein
LKLLELIFEAKAVGLLYHYTTPGAWWEIQDCDCLKASVDTPFDEKEFISTSRNKNLHRLPSFQNLGLSSGRQEPTIRLTLDGTKLSEKYKIRPHRYFQAVGPMRSKLDEYEERIYTRVIPNLSAYLSDWSDIGNETPKG